MKILDALEEHPDAPRYNHRAGDRLGPDDLLALDHFRAELAAIGPQPIGIHPKVIGFVAARAELVDSFRRRLEGRDFASHWPEIPTVSREDLAIAPERFIPDDADLDALLVYRTAGTTGHALLVPHHARAAASYQPLIERALLAHGVVPEFSADEVGCFLIGAQARTVTYPCTLSAWRGTGFAKLNLHPGDWPRPKSAASFFDAFAPRLVTGDPISYAEALRQEIPIRPWAAISTAVAMSLGLKRRLEAAFGAKVIDWYSLTETGPLGYACPLGEGYHQLSDDLHLEAIDPSGRPVPDGDRGEITVSGGRNPFLPLLRYRTGDFGSLDHRPCACGDPMPKILALEGRAPVSFKSRSDDPVSSVDLSRILREHPLVQHELYQARDRSVHLSIRPIASARVDLEAIEGELRGLFGDVAIEIQIDHELGARHGDKVLPYRSDFLLED